MSTNPVCAIIVSNLTPFAVGVRWVNPWDRQMKSLRVCVCVGKLIFFVTILQLKTQLNETLSKLKVDQNERQKVAGDLPKVRRDSYQLQI